MDLIRRHQAETGVVMVLIVPGEEAAAELFGVLDAAEAAGEFRLVFQGLEVGLRERRVFRENDGFFAHFRQTHAVARASGR